MRSRLEFKNNCKYIKKMLQTDFHTKKRVRWLAWMWLTWAENSAENPAKNSAGLTENKAEISNCIL